MKYIILILFIVGCGESVSDRFKKQATSFCSCYGGLESYVYISDRLFGTLEIHCKNGTKVLMKNSNTEDIILGIGEKCEN